MDIRHHYIEKGNGEPLILLHGNGENCEYFRGQVDAFAKCFHVYAIDTRGHGKTPRGEKPFTIRQFSEDLLGFMDEHHIKKANLLGFSDGGNIAMVFAIEHPERVDRLILNGANMNAAGVKPAVQIPIEIEYRIQKGLSRFSGAAKRKAELLGLMVNDPDVKPEELKTIQAKTLVIAGSKDMIRDSHTRFIAKCIPDSTLVIIKGDHFIANKRPIAFNRVIMDFMKA